MYLAKSLNVDLKHCNINGSFMVHLFSFHYYAQIMKRTKVQTLGAMVTAYYSPYSECIGYQLTTSNHVVHCIRYAAIPLAHVRYFFTHKMADRSKQYRDAVSLQRSLFKLILVTH